MTELELKLAATLLNKASKLYMNHGCSDFCLVKDGGLSEPEAVVMRTQICEHYGDELEADVDPPDWLLMSYLAERLSAEVAK